MKPPCLIAALVGVGSALALLPAGAQTSAAAEAAITTTRDQVKSERDEFLRTHRWDEHSATWVPKSGAKPPQALKSRDEVKAERDAFLSRHRWDNHSASWQPIGGAPREMSTLTREQRRADTERFMTTHQWNEQTQSWVEKKPHPGQ